MTDIRDFKEGDAVIRKPDAPSKWAWTPGKLYQIVRRPGWKRFGVTTDSPHEIAGFVPDRWIHAAASAESDAQEITRRYRASLVGRKIAEVWQSADANKQMLTADQIGHKLYQQAKAKALEIEAAKARVASAAAERSKNQFPARAIRDWSARRFIPPI